jgi:phage baseplate assembly protein W
MALFGCLPEKGKNGDFKTYEGLEVIMQSIYVILNTPKGSRVWQPEFGCGVMEYIWDLADDKTVSKMQSEIESALARWEPRIGVKSVTVNLNPYKQGVVDVDIDFSYAGKDYSKSLSMSTTNSSELTVYKMHY